jgi:hypothetical protein
MGSYREGQNGEGGKEGGHRRRWDGPGGDEAGNSANLFKRVCMKM